MAQGCLHHSTVFTSAHLSKRPQVPEPRAVYEACPKDKYFGLLASLANNGQLNYKATKDI